MATIDLAAPTRRPGHVTLRTRHVAVRLNYRVLCYALIAAGAVGLIAIWAMTLGSLSIPFLDVYRSVLGNGTEDQEYVVRTLRLPRVICAVLIGASLAMSGAIFQGLVRNPLVSPDVIGINAGASLCAVFWIVSGQGRSLLPVAALMGALLAAAVIYLFAWKRGIAASRLILVGIGVGAALSAGTSYLMVRYPVESVRPAVVWTMGSIYGSNWDDVLVLLVGLLALAPFAVALTWRLRALQLGDDVMRGLGLALERTRLGLIVIGCGLAAVSVAIAGPIGFVALMAPHVARMLAGPLSGSVMLFAGVLGALFLLASDVVAQHFLPVSLPVGAVTAAVGAPYFLFLLYRSSVRM
ncbi:MAG: FecCD family ABC transporter permease [Thermomicrobiales bacterium]